MTLREEADKIIKEAITKVLPDEAVKQALKNRKPVKGKLYLVAVGKAAWQMANAAANILNGQIEKGIVITKYGHIQGDIPGIECFEAGHPVPDTNTFAATQKVIELTEELQADDQVLFLLSGGGSALFENNKAAACMRGRYCRNEHHTEKTVRSQRRKICRTL